MFFVDLLYFLILYWGVMKIWNVWFSDCMSTSHALFFFFLQNLLRSMNNSVDLRLFLSSDRFGKFSKWSFIWDSKTKSSVWGHKLKMDFDGFLKMPQINMIGHFFSFFFYLFWEMGLSCFPNHQSEIMIDADLITLLYNLELGFFFFFFSWQTK